MGDAQGSLGLRGRALMSSAANRAWIIAPMAPHPLDMTWPCKAFLTSGPSRQAGQ